MNSLRELIKQYLEEQKSMQLCTVDNGNPWACTVWQASDDDLNIYFFAATNRRHSQEIAKDGRVAGALAVPQTPADKPRGLQFEGTACVIEDETEAAQARSMYQDRIFDADTIDKLIAHPDRPHKFYKITPKKFVLFDVVNFPQDSKQEYEV